MPVPTDITAGTISISGSTVTGVGTAFVASDIRQGDLFIWIEGGAGEWSPIVETVTSNTVLTLAEPWTGPTISGARYRLRYQWDSSRVSAQSRQLIEMLDNGNVLALSGLTGPGVPVFDGPHSMTLRPETDFINGVAYNVQVDTLDDRAAYDGQAAGFAVLVSNIGDGRTALYSKASNASGDWTDPAYITGPVGPASTVPGIVWRGSYAPGTVYSINDGITFNGSSFRKITTAGAGNAPSSASPPVNNTNWEVLSARGSDGTITGVTTFWQNRILNDTTASQAQFGLELIKQTGPLDATLGALLIQGAFGLGPGSIDVSDFTSAAVNVTRFFRALSTATGGPGVGGSVISIPYDGTPNVCFILYGPNGRLFVGNKIGATATPTWTEVFSRANILGTVSQSSGVPTGAIIERGNNANGNYVRYADGTQMCWKEEAVSGPINNANGSFFYSDYFTWVYPIAFIAPATPVFHVSNSATRWVSGGASNTATQTNTALFSQSGGGTVINARGFAIGRWF